MKLGQLHEELRTSFSKEELDWCKNHIVNFEYYKHFKYMKRTDDGEITVNAALRLFNIHQYVDQIPKSMRFQFSENFAIEYSVLTSFEVFPKITESILFCRDVELPNDSLKGLSSRVKFCNSITINNKARSGFLELFKIKGLSDKQSFPIIANTENSNVFRDWSKLKKVVSIVNKHLKDPNGNVFDCQNEMVDAGLERFC